MKAAKYGLLAAAVLTVVGCSMRQQVTIDPNGSGSAEVEVTLGPLIVQYMTDVIGSLGNQPTDGGTLFDLSRIRNAFTGLKGVELTSLSNPSRDTLRMGFSFDDVNSLFPELTAAAEATGGGSGARGPSISRQTTSPLVLTSHNGIKTLTLTLSRANWPAVAALPPFRDDPLLASLAPQGSKRYSEEEYLNLLEYAFADYANKQKIRQALTSSFMTIVLNVKGTVVSESGGARTGNSVTFRVPLIAIATLEKPIELSVSFR